VSALQPFLRERGSMFISSFRKYVLRLQQRNIYQDESHHRRLEKLKQYLQEVERARDDVLRRSAAKAACIECDLIMKIHQLLPKINPQPQSIEKDRDCKGQTAVPKHQKSKKDHLRSLQSLFESVKQDNRLILQELFKASSAANLREADSVEGLSAKDDRLKVSYYQALAEQGDLEPGNEKCSWIRDIFHMEARASQMEETAYAELQAAIE
jgi:hypothetical protein